MDAIKKWHFSVITTENPLKNFFLNFFFFFWKDFVLLFSFFEKHVFSKLPPTPPFVPPYLPLKTNSVKYFAGFSHFHWQKFNLSRHLLLVPKSCRCLWVEPALTFDTFDPKENILVNFEYFLIYKLKFLSFVQVGKREDLFAIDLHIETQTELTPRWS